MEKKDMKWRGKRRNGEKKNEMEKKDMKWRGKR